MRRLGFFAKQARERRIFLFDLLPKHAVGVEIGVHEGEFSRQLLARTCPTELHLIDPWEHQTADVYKDAWYGGKAKAGQREMDERYANVCCEFKEDIRAGRVKIHRGYSANILELFPDEYFDWMYIDGNHLYEYVKKDLALSMKKAKLGGLIAGDDYRDGGWWEGGVKKAVDELLINEAVQLVTIRNGQFILRKE